MAKYAVVSIHGNQYKVSEGEEILVDKLANDKFSSEVLLLVEDGKVRVGKPTIKGASIKFKILKDIEKGKKITVFKYKAKSRYRKKRGFRPAYTRLLVEAISKPRV